jgi:hypothetical protein
MNTFYFDDCMTGGSFGIGLNIKFMRAFASASLVLARPDTGPKSAIGITRYRTWITAELAGGGAPAFVDEGGAASPPGGSTPDATPWVSAPLGQTNPRVNIRLRCTAGDCEFSSSRPMQVRGAEVDLYEDVPPSGEIQGGTLLDATAVSGARSLSFSATDQESGVARVEALIGDTVVATADLEQNNALCPHTDLNACPARYASDFVIDTSVVPSGEHVVTLRITDAAGNRTLIPSPRRIAIGGGRTAETAKLTATFPRARRRYTTKFGRRVWVRGRLTGTSGKAIAGARIRVIERAPTGAASPTEASVSTDQNGKFTYVVSGRRPSRAITFSYFARPGDATPSASRRLQIAVRASSTLRVSLRGVKVRYSGRVLSRPLPRGGTRVYMEGRASGGAWQRFAVRRADGHGRFSGAYRLRVRRPGVKLQFRVVVPKQAGYPFAAGTGVVQTRTVR